MHLYHMKYNRSSIKGDENTTISLLIVYIGFKYNRSSIKGDENNNRRLRCHNATIEIQPLLDKRGREPRRRRCRYCLHLKYNRSSIKGDENYRVISIKHTSSYEIQPLLDKRGRELTNEFYSATSI